MNPLRFYILIAMCVVGLSNTAAVFGQAECNGWGSLRGIRVEGELMDFTSSIRVASPGWAQVAMTANERTQRPGLVRAGAKQTCTGTLPVGGMQGISFTEAIEDTGPGLVNIDLQCTSNADQELAGVYFFITLPASDYANGAAQLISAASGASESLARFSATQPSGQNTYLSGSAKGIRLTSLRRQLEVTFDSARQIIVQDERRRGDGGINVSFAIASGSLTQGQQLHTTFTIKAAGDIEKNPIKLTIDPSKPGRTFDGIGGNFRLQSPNDTPVIQYNLDNMRVTWGRVALPWREWQSNETTDPIAAAKAGQLNQSVRQAMEMARTLSQRKIPVIVSIWSPPSWAIIGGGARGGRGPATRGSPTTRAARGGAGAPAAPGPGVPRGNPLDPAKWDSICKSIGDYFVYMKENYGVEPQLFSFNESDLGIDVHQTAQEHADAIRHLGTAFASRGLATKMLLGDTSDATPVTFINPAMDDPEAAKYIGAVSFHCWRGGTDEQFSTWNRAAQRLNIPLFVAEGGIDPAAHNYRAIFVEPWFCLDEINLYVRICSLCQPKSIMEWQLTDDYSVLTGGRNNQPLSPTMRFWQLKQLGLTPTGSAWLPMSSDRPYVSFAAFGDVQKGNYSIHLVNTGATRPTTISGLPANLKQLRVYLTDAQRGMKEGNRIPVSGGTAQITLEAQTFTSLIAP